MFLSSLITKLQKCYVHVGLLEGKSDFLGGKREKISNIQNMEMEHLTPSEM